MITSTWLGHDLGQVREESSPVTDDGIKRRFGGGYLRSGSPCVLGRYIWLKCHEEHVTAIASLQQGLQSPALGKYHSA